MLHHIRRKVRLQGRLRPHTATATDAQTNPHRPQQEYKKIYINQKYSTYETYGLPTQAGRPGAETPDIWQPLRTFVFLVLPRVGVGPHTVQSYRYHSVCFNLEIAYT